MNRIKKTGMVRRRPGLSLLQYVVTALMPPTAGHRYSFLICAFFIFGSAEPVALARNQLDCRLGAFCLVFQAG
jgi:hypothetical protein